MNPLIKIFKFFLVWRASLFIPVILGSWFLSYGSFPPLFEISYYKDLPAYFNNPVFKTWSNFDGVHYLNIASDGYKTEARFFPLFPLLVFLLSFGSASLPVTYFIALLLPNIFFIAALFIFYNLLRLDYSEKDSVGSIISLLVFPTAFFLVAVYAESLFLLLLLASFYFARKGKWMGAILMGMLLISTRFVGIFIIPAMVYEYFIQSKTLRLRDYVILSTIFLITPLGLVAYAIYNYYKWGNFFYFLSAQGELGNSRSVDSLIMPPQTLYRYFKIFSTFPITKFEWWLALIEVATFIFGCVMFYIAFKKKVRISYLIFGALAFLLPSLSGTFSGLPRYMVIIFPIFITLGVIKSKRIKIYFVISITILTILLMFFSRGYFIA